MADITDPTAITFVNESLRRLADAEASAVFARRRFLADWALVSSLFPAGANEVIDGAQDDGRMVLDADDVIDFQIRMEQLELAVDTPGELNKLLKPAVNYDDSE